jgi:hypothetical protein
MKKLLIAILSLVFLSSAYAEDAKLRMKIAGPINNNRYFLCVSTVGCVSILNGNRGHQYPLNPGDVTKIFTVDAGNMSYHQQPLPASCNVKVNDNQTMTVTGHLVANPNGKVQINNLHCSVA